MKRFPESVRAAMLASGTTVTCVPIASGATEWEAAVFFELAGPECKEDRRALSRQGGDGLRLGVGAELIEQPSAAVVLLSFEVHTTPQHPLAGDVLLAPGQHESHFRTLELLGRQARLRWFFGDHQHWVFDSRQCPLTSEHHRGFAELLGDAVRHDAMVRMTSRYDATAALAGVAERYQLAAPPPP